MKRATKGLLLAVALVAGVGAVATEGPIGFSLTGPARGDLAAVSVFGDASADFVAISVMGAAESRVFAVSVAGPAESSWACVLACVGGVAVSGLSESRAPFGVAVSGTGEADGYYEVDGQAADVSVDGDAHGKVVAVSGSGNATADVVSVAMGEARCGEKGGLCGAIASEGAANGTLVALSRAGDAHAGSSCVYWVQGCGVGGVAGSGGGHARGNSAAASLGPSATCTAWPCVAVAPEGTAQACFAKLYVPCVGVGGSGASGDAAATLQGHAEGGYVVSVLGSAAACNTGYGCTSLAFGDADGYHAFSLTGNATSPCPSDGFCEGTAVALAGSASCGSFPCAAVSVLGAASGRLVGASVVGDAQGNHASTVAGSAASCNGLGCTALTAVGDARGALAVSGTGDATSCDYWGCAAVTATGTSRGWLAVSVTGRAEGTTSVSGCNLIDVLCVPN